jgi:hypothetical protein
MSFNQSTEPGKKISIPRLVSTEPITRHVVILTRPDDMATIDLTLRLREIGAQTTVVQDFEEAQRMLEEASLDIGAILIPTHFETKTLGRTLDEALASAPPEGLGFISVGKPPSKFECKNLRKAGVKLALWNPLCEAYLRFQINRALYADHNGFGNRGNPRVPTELGCTVKVGQREKETLIYSLAANGAYLATRRASMSGARLDLDLRLPDQTIATPARVVYANVPGNLQRPGLPLGMGVQFDPLGRNDQKRLKKYIVECIETLEV